ncbi:MAG: PhoPQ-activated protein PqaA family protein [Planctomycetota bacterium]|nr:PhoPQ-activated protein PqaA family protein [Planctomycetota bacterium]
MKNQLVGLIAICALLACTQAAHAQREVKDAPPAVKPGPLRDYVQKADPAFKWTKRREGKIGKGTYAELILTSQEWKGITWKHQLLVYKPATIKLEKQALLWIHAGRWDDEMEKAADASEPPPTIARLMAQAGDQMQCPVAILMHVPHQPIFDGMIEDQIISYTFMRYIVSGDSEWPLLLPMVKSAVRGMDAVQQFSKQEWSLDVEHFTVTGASKRGWTTWLTAAIDSRVTALAPMVIDMLNMAPQMKLQVESFGTFSEQLHDYTEKGLQRILQTEPGKKLLAIVDPYHYLPDIRQPKLIILGTNDRYWPLEALNLYWNDLVGERYILYVPNNGHGLRDYARILGSINALNQHVAAGKALPKLDWKFTTDAAAKVAKLKISSDIRPSEVRVWTAKSKSRDFRNSTFTSVTLPPSEGDFTREMDLPASGYIAIFGELVFDKAQSPYYFSTNVRVFAPESAKTPGK